MRGTGRGRVNRRMRHGFAVAMISSYLAMPVTGTPLRVQRVARVVTWGGNWSSRRPLKGMITRLCGFVARKTTRKIAVRD